MASRTSKILKALHRQGFEIRRTKKGHWQVRSQEGIVVMGSKDGEHRTVDNTVSALKKIGFDPERKK